MNLLRRLGEFDALIAGCALAVMLLVPLLEIGLRPLFGAGIDNAPVLVQHCGLLLAMFGALLAERGLHEFARGGVHRIQQSPCAQCRRCCRQGQCGCALRDAGTSQLDVCCQ